MTETTTTSNDGAVFRKFALVLMICLIAFGVLELANVIKI
jgi:hypothetical protein